MRLNFKKHAAEGRSSARYDAQVGGGAVYRIRVVRAKVNELYYYPNGLMPDSIEPKAPTYELCEGTLNKCKAAAQAHADALNGVVRTKTKTVADKPAAVANEQLSPPNTYVDPSLLWWPYKE